MNIQIRSLCLAAIACTASFSLLPAKADWNFWAVDYSGDPTIGNRIFTVDSETGLATLRTTRVFASNGWQSQNSYVDEKTGELVIYNAENGLEAYDLATNSWSIKGAGWTGNYQKVFERPLIVGTDEGGSRIGLGTASIIANPNGKGVSSGDGQKLIRVEQDGEIHIGENSLITVEENGVQKLYAKDANGNAIPINITEGTKLLIDGVEVTPGDSSQVEDNRQNISTNQRNISTNQRNISTNQRNISTNQRNIEANRQNINDLGFGVAGATALSTAMTALPTVADDSPLSCGVGTGGYSSRYAMSVGCAVKASERLSFNAGGSYVFGGAADYGNGSLSNVAGRAGFVFKLGEIQSSSKGDLQARVKELEKANQAMQEENAAIKEQNAAMQSTNKQLMARLERLEAIASVVFNQNSVASK
ncbi:hypothetical protein CWE17_11350 [Synechococcus sp. BS56D]|uniref:YadA-like family protein n=1 Tax=Synechococcus sp. BS56D TaxID=2055944 RepID=UPI00103E3D1A|nr:YadA-like family protein [Synechococcus sp. BS56D]TCD55394.1 hypothetical protein CWE17_11350 [Synechococcus sp. BS56D]